MTKTIRHITRRSQLLLSLAIAAVLVLMGRGSGRVAVLAQGGSCATPANAVVAENCQAGDTDWDLTGGNDPTIQGFATDISVDRGQTVYFKINTDAISYRIDIYRLGYYGGAGARKITSTPIALAQPQAQPACASDATSGLVDCGTWATSASWSTAGQTSGIYLAKLTRTDGLAAGASHIVFVVRDDARQSALLFQTSDTTWQAYNRYGGNSLYTGTPTAPGINPPSYSSPRRAYKVSYNRPFDTRDHDPQSWVFNAEYPMVRWVEANGYDVSYFTGVDSDRSGARIKDHKAFLSVGHDEYWSAGQRTNVEAARDAGVHLAFFSGNEVFWKTRWEASIDGTSTAHRTLVSYKETLNNAKIDPDPAWTGTWRDARFSPPADGGRPENGLTGTIWTVNCCTYAITVPAELGAQRVWRNTGVDTLAPGTVATLAANSLGYEWDEDLDNGFRPAGLARLSSTIVDVPEKLLDNGSIVGPGTATHALTLYRKNTQDAQGLIRSALVFGAGTVQWSWGLDGNHDRGSSVPDPRMQQATVNLFADMGVQPGSIRSGLSAASASTDSVAPSSTITSPVLGATAESGGRVTIRGTAADTGGGVVGGVEVSVDGGVTWHAAKGRTNWTYDWSPGATGTVTVRSRATDDSGNVESPSAGVLVTVVGSICPCSHLWNPATAVPVTVDAFDASSVEVGVRFSSDIDGFITAVRFYKASANTGTHIGNLWTSGGTLLSTATFTNETASGWQQVRLPSPVPIVANTTYVASYHTNVGHYSSDVAYFATGGVNSAPLHAPMSGAAGNGVFTYGASVFPTTAFHASNYWVDVTFAQSVADSSAPTISQVRVNALDGSTAVVTWKTNEEADSRVDYSTDQSFPTAQTLSVADAAFVLDHSLTLTGLTPNNTYYMRLTSSDRAGNPVVFLTPSFTVPGPTLHDTASVDFLAGTQGNTYVAQAADGELTLAPAVGSEFYGTSLPSGWTSVLWQPSVGGSVSVGGGKLTVDGARVGTCDVTLPDCEAGVYGPGHSLEFVATFTGDPFQHAGLGVKLEGPPWALFSTGSGSTLNARTNAGAGNIETPLGTDLLGAPHRFRIEWTASSVNYLVDGVPVGSHAVAISTLMRPIAASDFNPFSGNIVVDWIRLLPYASSGSFVSRVFDAATAVDWASVYWTSVTPPGTSLAIYEHTGDTATADGTWTNFALVTAPGEFTRHPHARYVQYRADLTTSDPSTTPQLTDIIISTDHAPVAVNDAAATNLNTSKTFSASPLSSNSLMFNDTDADTPKAQLRVVTVSTPAHGAATINSTGSVTYTPVAGFVGTDSFTYTITDGLLTSNAATVSIVVGGHPTANPETVTVLEDSAANTINVLANDVHTDAGMTLTVTAVTQGANGAVAIVGGGTAVTYTPITNFFGNDGFTYTISDTLGITSSTTVSVIVAAVNHAPSFVKGADQLILEDAGLQTVPGWATAISAGPANEAGQTLNFIVSNNNNALFVAQPAVASNGALTYTPAANMNGSATVTVQLHDDGGTANGGSDTSAAQTFTIAVTAVNDAPSFIKGADQVTLEDAGAQTVAGWATAISAGPADEAGQALNFIVSNDNNALFAAQPAVAANGTLTYTAAANANGSATVSVQLHDNGGTANGGADTSAAQSFTISVTGVNDAPSFVKGSDLTVLEDAGAQSVAGWATAISAGPADEAGQTLNFIVGNNNNALFAAQPAVASNGTLTYTPAANMNGSATVTVQLHDDGGTANGGSDTSAAQTFTITVTAVNDAPSFVKGADQVTLEDAGVQTVSGWATAISAGPNETQALNFIVTNNNNALFAAQPAVAANGTLTYTAAANANGSAAVTVQLHDDGGTANGGSDTSPLQTFTITVTAVNDAPSFTKGPNQTVQKNSGARTVPAWATNLSAGPADEAGQILSFTASNDNGPLFSAAPAIAANGTLTYTPAAGAVGVANVTVRLSDNGGTANGGVDASTQSFTITVFDPPPVALCQNVTVTATLIGTAVASVNAGSFDPDGGPVTLAHVPPGPYLPGQTTVILNVTDSAAHTTSCSATVTVNPFAPGASFGFEELSGNTVLDSSGNQNHGTFNATNGPQRTAAGRFGRGMVFDGIDDLITVADSNSLDLTSAMTMMAWVKVNNQTGWRNILMKQNGNDLAYALYANNNQSALGQPNGYVRIGTTTRSAAATEGALQGQWMHVAATYGGGSLKMYVNGMLERTVAVTGNVSATTGPLWLGGDLVWLDEYFSGVMDEVRILGVTLSESDVRTLMRTPVVPGTAPPATDPTALVAAYNFNDGTATDVTGHGHNGVLNGPVSAPGIYGQALSFNGTSALVSIADANDLHLTTGMTLEAWVRPNTLNSWRSLVLKEAPQGLAYALYGSDQAQHGGGFVNIAGTDRDVRALDPLPTNAWSHVVATYDKTAGRLRIFVDGVPRDERQVTGDITTSTGSLFIGGNQIWGEYFDGRIDNVRIYNRALNIVEIQTNQATPVF